MYFIKKIFISWNTHKKKLLIKRIRQNLYYFGYDIDEYTDKEIEDNLIEFSKQIGTLGFKTQELEMAFIRLGEAIGEAM